MPGETYQTLKEKYTKQTGSSTLGTAMANQAAQVANQSSENNQGFFGQQQEEQFGVKGASETEKEALQGQTYSDIQKNEEQQKKVADEVISTEKKKNEKEKTKFNLFDFWKKYSPTSIVGQGVGALLNKLLGVNPRAEQMSDPNSLSIIRSLLLNEKGELDPEKVKRYYEDHKDIIDEGILDSGIGSLEAAEGTTGLSGFDAFKDIITSANPEGIQGTRSQQMLAPWDYYDKELYETLERPVAMEDYPEFLKNMGLKPLSSRFANTTGNLVNIANIDPNMKGMTSDFRKKIFDARMDLDRQGINWLTGNRQGEFRDDGGGGGGGGNIPPVSPPTDPDDPIIPEDPTLPPGVTPPTTTPKYPGSVVTDYTQLGLPNIYNNQMPNYANFYKGQGGQPVGLQNYLDNLRKRFGLG